MQCYSDLQDTIEDCPNSSYAEAPPFLFAQSLPWQPAYAPAGSGQRHTSSAPRPVAVTEPLQGYGLVQMQSLALLLDCFRLYAGFGTCSREQVSASIAPEQSSRLDQLLTLVVTAEARASAMRVLLLASKPAVGRPDYVNAVQGGPSCLSPPSCRLLARWSCAKPRPLSSVPLQGLRCM